MKQLIHGIYVLCYFCFFSCLVSCFFYQDADSWFVEKLQRNITLGQSTFSSGDMQFYSGNVVEFFVSFGNITGGPVPVIVRDYFPEGFVISGATLLPGTGLLNPSCFIGATPVVLGTPGTDFCSWDFGFLADGVSSAILYRGVMSDASSVVSGYYYNQVDILGDALDLLPKDQSVIYQTPDMTTGSCSIIISPNEVWPGGEYVVSINVTGAAGGSFFIESFNEYLLLTGVTEPSLSGQVPVPPNGLYSTSFSGFFSTDTQFTFTFASGLTITPGGLSTPRPIVGTGIYAIHGTGFDGQPFSCSGSVVSDIQNSIAMTKYQRNVTQNFPVSGYTSGDILYASGDLVSFYIEFENLTPFALTSDNSNTFFLQDLMPYGFCGLVSGGVVTGLDIGTGAGVGGLGGNPILGYYSLGTGTICPLMSFVPLQLAPYATGFWTYTGTMLAVGEASVTNRVKVADFGYSYCIDMYAYQDFVSTFPPDVFYDSGFDITTYSSWVNFYDNIYLNCPVATASSTLIFSGALPHLTVAKYQRAAYDSGFSVNCASNSCTPVTTTLDIDGQDRLEYSFVVSNTGSLPAENVVLYDILPLGFTPVAPYPAGCVVTQIALNPDRYVLECGRPELDVGGQRSIALPGRIVYDSSISNFSNLARISADNDPLCRRFEFGVGIRSLSPCASSTVQALVMTQAQFQFTKAFVPSVAVPGDIVQVVLTYNNIGPQTGMSVQVRDVLQTGLLYIGSTGSFISYNATTQSWNVGNVPSGSGGVIYISAQVAQGFTASSISNTASVVVNGVTNVAASDTLDIVGDLGIDIVKSVTIASATHGDVLRFTLDFVNNEIPLLTSYQIKDILPPTLSYVPNSAIFSGIVGQYNPVQVGSTLTRECMSTMPASLCPLPLGSRGSLSFDAIIN